MADRDPRQVQRQAADRTLSTLEDAVARVVSDALDTVAEVFAVDLARAAAEEHALTAALDDILLRRLVTLWAGQLQPILTGLLRVYQAAAQWLWRRLTTQPVPDEVQDLPQRWQRDPRTVPERVQQYMAEASNRLAGVGDRLWEAARAELAAGTLAGEGVDQLARRLRDVFADDGSQLGPARAQRIARTETAMVWNRAVWDQAMAMPEDLRPLYKSWLATADTRTRHDHWQVDGVTVPLAAVFSVGGVSMAYPGDPIAPPAQNVNCRCTLTMGDDPEPPADDGRQYLSDAELAEVIAYFEEQGIVRTAHPQPDLSAASGGPHTGGMIALLPSQADIDRLAVEGGELPRDLHLTLLFLGKGAEVPAEARDTLVSEISRVAEQRGPIDAHGWNVSMFNPAGDEPCWVLGVGGAALQEMHLAAVAAGAAASSSEWAPPEQHTPWVPHVTLTYTSDLSQITQLVDRVGPITFDRLRVAVGEEVVDLAFAVEEEEELPASDQAAVEGPPPRRWSTPGDTALAFENMQTGDGRVFTPGALYWEAGPWPLQYADEMLGGHDGAELAGAIQEVSRDGDRIPGAGVLYPGQAAGENAIRLLEEGAPLGVSVDLDDVDIEFLDARPADQREDADEVMLMASLSSASVMQLLDGGWAVRATQVVNWTADASPSSGSVRATHTVEWTTSADGKVAATGLRALAAAGAITAAAGDTDAPDGEVLFREQSGDYLMRITRGRLRGATLVSVPAFAGARIVLEAEDATAAGCDQATRRMQDVIVCVSGSPVPVAAADVADALSIPVTAARDHLARAAETGHIRRLARGLYVGTSTLPDGPAVDQAVTAATVGDEEREGDDEMSTLEASAWSEMRNLPPLHAGWFREPTVDELPPGSGGVHYADGRIYGWVAQRGVPHEGHPGRNLTIESLGDIDTTAFLRAQMRLDDGSTVKVGAFTMNVGHHRDGAECETAACQFDDTRTVAGIVTVGMSEGGMWFSGAAAPWLSEWDRMVFAACQPSYHMRQERSGKWSLRAVLSVPVPGHPSKLAASAVVERSNMALAASAAPSTQESSSPLAGLDVDALAAALAPAVAAELERRAERQAEIAKMAQQLAPARAQVAEALKTKITEGV